MLFWLRMLVCLILVTAFFRDIYIYIYIYIYLLIKNWLQDCLGILLLKLLYFVLLHELCFCCAIRRQIVLFEIAEMTRFLNYITSYLFALKIVNLKNLESTLQYVYIELLVDKSFKCKVINIEIFSRDLYL